MHSYKSLIMVAGLGGVLLFMAGVLLNTEHMARNGKPEQKTFRPIKKNFTKLDYGGSMSDAKPDKGLFEEDIKIIREVLSNGRSSYMQTSPRLKQALAHGQAVVQATDFPLLAAEIKRKDNPPAYDSILIIMLGASKADAAMPILKAQYKQHPIRVVDALKLSKTRAAFRLLNELYAESTTPQERYCLIQAFRKMPSAFGTEFLVERLKNETDMVSLGHVITLTRFVRSRGIAEALTRFITEESERSTKQMRSACNALGAQIDHGGAEMLLSLHVDPAVQESVRKEAGVAVSFMKAPDAVPGLIARSEAIGQPTAEIAKFIFRNARREHLETMNSLVAEKPASPWVEALKPAISRLSN